MLQHGGRCWTRPWIRTLPISGWYGNRRADHKLYTLVLTVESWQESGEDGRAPPRRGSFDFRGDAHASRMLGTRTCHAHPVESCSSRATGYLKATRRGSVWIAYKITPTTGRCLRGFVVSRPSAPIPTRGKVDSRGGGGSARLGPPLSCAERAPTLHNNATTQQQLQDS